MKIERTFTIEKKHTDPFGEAMTAFFGKNCYWLKKFNRARVERAFDIAQKNNDKNFGHLMQNIYHG
jgi:hypothetical protein